MRIPTKLVLGLATASAVILGSYGLRELRKEKKDLTDVAKHDMRVLGTALKVAIENALRDKQVADIHEILASLKLKDSSIEVMVFDPAGDLSPHPFASPGSATFVRDSVREVNSSGESQVRIQGASDLSRIVGIFPLRDDDGSNLGTIAIVRPLDVLRADLRSETISTILSILTLIAGVAGVGWFLVHLYVRRPLMNLMIAMKDVRAGNLTASVSVQRTDEVGVLTAEFNSMVRELASARSRLIEAAESREALEAGLRRVDKLATLGQLSAGLGHEIGSPLQILNGRARVLASRTDLPADVRRTAQILEQQSDRIAKIVEQLLSVSRRRPAHRSEIDMGATVDPIVDLLEHEARRRAVRLEFERPASPLKAVADVDQVQQVTLNLLSNALRATPRAGRVRLTLAASSFKAGDGEHPSVSLAVDDTGCGIAEELLGRIFEPFFTTWTEVGGAGLGLAVVKSIVDEHGGTIAVQSDKDVGTRFVVHFPVAGVARGEASVA
ncbi:MAG: ATP-binding protein [Polyangia bacterium]